jgi:diguanylate cyclase (GGDEF)-like protein
VTEPGETPRPGFGAALARYLDRHPGGQTGDVGRAARAAQVFLAFSLVLTSAFAVFFAAYDAAGLRPVVVSSVVAVALMASGLAFVARGRQLTASIIAVLVGTAQAAFVTTWVGWIAGFHLYLVAGGQLVFMLFTDRQRLLRLGYVVLAIGTFFYCQLAVPERGLGTELPQAVDGVLFSINATLALLMVFVLAAAGHSGAALARARADGATVRAEYLANTDELTGLSNRRPVLRRLDELSASVPYVVAIADLDHFKRLNDTFGHECGDRVLAAVGARLKSGLRASDSVGRWGGEEFIFVMEQSTIADAAATMERLRAELAAPLPCTGHSHEITMSVGVTDALPDGMAQRTLQRADEALYEAKAAGRNVVHVIPGPESDTDPTPRRRLA